MNEYFGSTFTESLETVEGSLPLGDKKRSSQTLRHLGSVWETIFADFDCLPQILTAHHRNRNMPDSSESTNMTTAPTTPNMIELYPNEHAAYTQVIESPELLLVMLNYPFTKKLFLTRKDLYAFWRKEVLLKLSRNWDPLAPLPYETWANDCCRTLTSGEKFLIGYVKNIVVSKVTNNNLTDPGNAILRWATQHPDFSKMCLEGLMEKEIPVDHASLEIAAYMFIQAGMGQHLGLILELDKQPFFSSPHAKFVRNLTMQVLVEYPKDQPKMHGVRKVLVDEFLEMSDEGLIDLEKIVHLYRTCRTILDDDCDKAISKQFRHLVLIHPCVVKHGVAQGLTRLRIDPETFQIAVGELDEESKTMVKRATEIAEESEQIVKRLRSKQQQQS